MYTNNQTRFLNFPTHLELLGALGDEGLLRVELVAVVSTKTEVAQVLDFYLEAATSIKGMITETGHVVTDDFLHPYLGYFDLKVFVAH